MGRGGVIMFVADVDTTQMNLALARFAKESRKEVEEIIEKQSGIIVGHLIAMTPPAKARGANMSDRGGIAASAKKLGEATIRADIASLFPSTRMKREKVEGMIDSGFRWGTGRGAKKISRYAGSVAELKRIHAQARSKKTGRVRTGSIGQNMALTKAAIRNQFARDQIKRVGILNAGWLRAARKLKTAKRATPAWITRHGDKPGAVNFRRSRHGLAITVSNHMDYFPKNINQRIQRAVDRRARGLEKAIEAMLERKAKRATKRMQNRS